MNARRQSFRLARGASIRRPACLPAALLAAAFALLAAAPASAAALVSNIGQTTTWNVALGSQTNPRAQQFTTGANSYTLNSIDIKFHTAVGTPANLRVELWSAGTPANRGVGVALAPDAKLASLTVPATVGTGTVAFAAPAHTTLAASTKYFVYVYRSGATTGNLAKAAADAEDAGAAAGWSIANNEHNISTGLSRWGTSASSLQIRVNGALLPSAPAEGDSVWSATLTPREVSSTHLGCNATSANKCDASANLSEDDFTYRGSSYTIDVLQLNTSSSDLSLRFTSSLPDYAKRDLVLVVGSNNLNLADFTKSGASFVSTGTSLSFTAGTGVAVGFKQRTLFILEPENVSASASGNTLNVSWDANSIGDTPLSYNVHYTTSTTLTGSSDNVGSNPATQWVDTGYAGATTSYTITGLNYATLYRVRVSAHSELSSSSWAEGQNARATTGAAPDVTLSALTVSSSTSAAGTFSALTLSPSTFAAATTQYSALVASSISHVKLTPTVNDSSATVQVGTSAPLTAVNSGTASAAIALTAGANAIMVVVAAQDGITTKTYMVRITRQNASGDQVIWAATLTVDVDGTNDFYGCDTSDSSHGDCSSTSVLTDDEFTHAGKIYFIEDLYWVDSTDKFAIAFLEGTNKNDLTGALTKAAFGSWTLTVDGMAFTISSAAAGLASINWPFNPNPAWVDGQVISVSLSAPPTTPTTPTVRLSATPSTVAEGSPVTVTATLSAALNAAVRIPLTLTAGSGTTSSDYGRLASITIPSGQTSASGTITTTRDADADDETFTVALGTLPNSVAAGSPNSVTITINDADAPKIPTVSLSVTPNPVREGDSVTVTVTLSPTTSGDQSIPIILTAGSATSSSDYGTLTAITITGGQTTGTGTITTIADDNNNADGTLTVAIGTPPTGVSVGSPSSEVVTIDDTDPSTLTLSADTLRVIPGEAATITAAIDENAPANTEVMLAYTPSRSTGTYTLEPRTLTITSGSKISTAAAILTVSEDAAVGTKIEITATDPMSGTYRLTVDPLVIEVVSPLQAEQLHRAALPEVARALAGRVTSAISARAGQVLNGRGGIVSASLGGQSTLAGALQAHAPGVVNENRSLRDLLHGSNFVLPLNGGGDGNGLGSVSVWGNGEYRNLSGEDGDLEFDGSLHGAQIGVDAKLRDNMMAGVALSWSEGDLQYEVGGGSGSTSSRGDYELDVISLHPYLGGRAGQLDWWATLGYGNGELVVTPNAGQAASNDMSMTTLGAGGSGVLWSRDDTRVHLKGEFTRTRMDVEKSAQVDSLSVSTHLARIALAASRTRSLAGGGGQRVVVPSLSLGVRQDGGDGNIGTGAEIGGSVRYENAESGMSASVSTHGLFGRSDYEEWGIQGMVRLSPGADGQGLSFVMRPGYGNGGGAGNTGRIWSNGLRGDHALANRDASGRLEMRLGYGLSAAGERSGLLTPWGGLNLEGDGKRYRLGLDWASGGPFTLRLHGERRESANSDADHAVLLRGEARF